MILLPIDIQLAMAIRNGNQSFYELTGYTLPDPFSIFPDSMNQTINLLQSAENKNFGFAFIHQIDKAYIGQGGYFYPDANDTTQIEIGYEVVAGYQRQGYATEYVQNILGLIFNKLGCKKIIAHTLPYLNPSNRLLIRKGFVYTGQSQDPDEGKVWDWALNKKVYQIKNYFGI